MAKQRKRDGLDENLLLAQDHSEDDLFFADIFTDFESVLATPDLLQTSGCPPHEVFVGYIHGKLPDQLTFDSNHETFLRYLAGETKEWNKSAVSLHVLCCGRCQETVEAERVKLAHAPPAQAEKKRFWQRAKGQPIKLELGWHATLASATLTAILVTLNWLPFLVNPVLDLDNQKTRIRTPVNSIRDISFKEQEEFTKGDEGEEEHERFYLTIFKKQLGCEEKLCLALQKLIATHANPKQFYSLHTTPTELPSP